METSEEEEESSEEEKEEEDEEEDEWEWEETYTYTEWFPPDFWKVKVMMIIMVIVLVKMILTNRGETYLALPSPYP